MTEFVKQLTTFFVVSHKENFCYDIWHAAMISDALKLSFHFLTPLWQEQLFVQGD